MGNRLNLIHFTALFMLCGIIYLLMVKLKYVSQTDNTATDNSLMSECTKCIKTERIPSSLRFVNSKLTSYRDDLRIKLDYLISRRADARDPELISLVRQFLDPPSRHQIKPVKQIGETPQSTEVLKLLNDKVCCFGALF